MLLMAAAVDILAQAGAPVDASAVQVQSVWDFIVKGGVMMIPIGICSLVALAVFVERMVSLRRKKVIPPGFMDGLKGALQKNGEDRSEPLEYCRKDASPTANVFAAAIRRLDEPLELLERHVEQAGEREVFKLRRFLRVLAVVASIAPLMGLLGTIFGMIRAFQTVAMSAEALGKTESLARGIYEALITTAAGLSVAIPVLIAYHWISAKIDRLVGEMDQMTVEFVEEHARGRPRRASGKTSAPVQPDERMEEAPEAVATEVAAT
jgi:biopolymer transport protein ExbB